MLASFLLVSSLLQPVASVSTVTAGNSDLVDSTVTVLLKAFQHPYTAALISQAASSPEGDQHQTDLVNDVISKLHGLVAVRFNVASNATLRRPWIRHLLFFDSLETFGELYQDFSVDKYDFSGRYLLVYSGHMDESIAQSVFHELWRLQIVNVVLVVEGENGAYLWTYAPYTEKSCRSVNLVEMPSVDQVEDFYPSKTSNFFGCTFKVGSFESRPYTIMDRSDEDNLRMSGFEGDLLDVLKSKLNFEVSILEPEHGEQWGYALPKNSTGIMRMIQEEEVDFGISCLGISIARNAILKAGFVHYTTALVLAVPKGRPYTGFEKFFRPFNANVWWSIAVTVFGATCTIVLIESRDRTVRDFVYGRGIRTPYLNMVQVFFGIGMHQIPSRNFARTLLLQWIILCFILRSLYQGAMVQYLQQKSTLPPSRTLAEIDQTEALYYVVESAERYYESFPHRYRRVRHLPQEKNNIIRRLEWMTHHPESNDVVMGGLDHMAHHNHLYRRKGGFIHVCHEFISTYTIAVYYPKKSMLTEEFDNLILRVQASGLMDYWIRQYGDYDFFQTPRESSEPKRLSNEHLIIAYQMCGVLLIVSGVVFGLELVSGRAKRVSHLLERLSGMGDLRE